MQADSAKHGRLAAEEIIPLTKEALEQGKTKQQVFAELAPRFYSREHLAQLISTVPDVELRKKYARMNQALVVIMVLACVSQLVLLLITILTSGFSRYNAIDPTFPVLLLLLARGVHRITGGMYLGVGSLALANALTNAVHLVPVSSLWAFANIALFTTTAILAFYLGGHLFPNRGWTGPRKDEGGNYLL